MPQPTVIQGPALITQNSYSFYTKGDVILDYKRATWNPETSVGGKLGPRVQSTEINVSFTPAGMYTSATAAKYWPFAATDIGKSVFTAANLPLVILPITGSKITFPRSGMTKMPGLKLSARSTLWGSVEFTCLGDPALVPTNAAYFQAIAATTADANFDETKVISPRYTAAWGATWTGLEPDDDGIDISPILEVKRMETANYGLQDIIITSLGLEAMMAPVSRTEAEIAQMLLLQDTTALRPGDTIGSGTDDFVVTGTGLTFTGSKMGVQDAGLGYGSGIFRQRKLKWVNRRTWAAGVPNALWTFA